MSWRSPLTISLIAASVMLCGAFTVSAQDEAKKDEAAKADKKEPPKPVTVTVQQLWKYDADALKKATKEADADEETGSQTGKVLGSIQYIYSNGSSRTVDAVFSQTLEKDASEPGAVTAEEAGTDAWFNASNIWMMVATFLVFIMHLGFASLESGLTRAKNTTNILFKNTAIISIGILTYAIIGFNLAYPSDWFVGDWVGDLFAFGVGPGEGDQKAGYAWPGGLYPYWTDFLFQAMFAATAATIVSGAVAERIKLGSFLIFSTIFVAICYPIVVSWQWGGGFLSQNGFHDFAGSTLVHSVGGWGALVCAFMLGARKGKYTENGKSKAIPGHNLPLATIGVFLLWLGWFGFNGGSVLSGDANGTSFVLVTTSLAAAAGVMGAMVTTWLVQSKPDLTMILNGALAGLVGITAGADVINPLPAVVVGAAAGVLVVFSVLFIDQFLKIDDPVGAISVHLVCGIWGTLAVGIFGEGKSFGAQILGVVVTGIFCVLFAGILFAILKATLGVRVDEKDELQGLDISEHGLEAYAGFQTFSNI